jgi:polyene glycosyltransferase
MITAALAAPGAAESSTLIFDWIYSTHPCMYVPLVAALAPAAARNGSLPAAALLIATPNLAHPTDVLVSDIVTTSGTDAARTLRVPLVHNNADLLYVLSPRVLPPADSVPMMFREHSLLDLGAAWLERVAGPPLRLLVGGLVRARFQSTLNAHRSRAGLMTEADIFRSHSAQLVLQNTAWGLEPPRAVPPHVHLVGPCLPIAEMPAAAAAALSDEDRAWLALPGPVVLVSMGTLARLDARQTDAIVRGALAAGLAEGRVRLLWKADAAQKAAVQAAVAAAAASGAIAGADSLIDVQYLRLTSWVSSQLGVLAHPRTRVFLSHCGINSAHETALAAGGRVQLLCVPMFGDQLDMAQRVRDAGVGLYLNKLTFTAHHVTRALTVLVAAADDPVAAARGTAVRRVIELAGGTARAAELLVFAGETYREARRAREAALSAAVAAAAPAADGVGAGMSAGGATAMVAGVPAVRYWQQRGNDIASVNLLTRTGATDDEAAAAAAAAAAATAPTGDCVGFGCGDGLSDGVGLLVPRETDWATWRWLGLDVYPVWALFLCGAWLAIRGLCRLGRVAAVAAWWALCRPAARTAQAQAQAQAPVWAGRKKAD